MESGELKSLLLFGVDPLRDFPDTDRLEARPRSRRPRQSPSRCSRTHTTAKADVVFPLETHAEKDGTVTHPDGRLQRVRPSASRPGDIRPNLQVLAELSAALGHDTGIASQPTAFAAITEAVPFYAGIDDAEIGGRGIRWQDRPESLRAAERYREGGRRYPLRTFCGIGTDHSLGRPQRAPADFRERRGYRRPPPPST